MEKQRGQSAEYRVHASRVQFVKPAFQKLVVWQKAQNLATEIVGLVDGLPGTRSPGTLGNQVLRSAYSVAANVAEGYGRYSEPAYRHHLSIARGSLFETESWFDLLRCAGYVRDEQADQLTAQCEEIARMLTATVKPLRTSKSFGEEVTEYVTDA